MFRRPTFGLLAASLLVALRATAAARPGLSDPNPFKAAPFFVDPGSQAAKQARAWRRSHPAWARAMRKVASQPQADCFTDPSPARVFWDIRLQVDRVARAGQLPVLVPSGIPTPD